MNWKIELYKKLNGDIPVLEYILSLPPKHRAKIEIEIDILEKHGINLIYPSVLKLKGSRYKGLWEMRIKFSNNISRIIYFLYKENIFILLHAFSKKSYSTPKKELNIARDRMNEYLKREV
ncbi:MAG: type II toxin-antitoxin system RelE/ParE family toxin [Actinobacteria bacterium]|nr:type II toxin-antitoxin system RelE/ParE family toxin [Actinomycetota bacterium]